MSKPDPVRSVSLWFNSPDRKGEWVGIGLTVAAAVASGAVLLRPGLISAVDVWPHLVRQQVVAETLADGVSPFWTFLFYGGFPLLRFYGPLLALMGGLLQLAVGDALVAMKLLLFVLHGLSGWAMYALLRRRAAPVAAGLGAVAYLFVPWRLISLLTEGNLPQALAYLFLPLVFIALDRLRPGNLRAGAVALGLWLGLLALAHPYYALLGFLLVVMVVMLEPFPRSRATGLAVAVLVAVAVAGFFVLPFLAEYRGHVYPVLPLPVPRPDIRVLLWPWSRMAGYRGFYFGLSVVLGGLAAAGWSLWRRRARVGTGFLLALGLAALASWVAPAVGLVPTGQPSGRALLFAVFGLAGLVGLGADRLNTRARRRRDGSPGELKDRDADTGGRMARATRAGPGRRTRAGLPAGMRGGLLALGLAAVLAVDCLPAVWSIRFVPAESALPLRRELYELIPRAPTPRLFDCHNHAEAADDFPRLGAYPALGYLFGGLGSVFGPPYHQFAPRSMMYVYPWAGFIARDLGDPTRQESSPLTARGLALAGVTHIIAPPAELEPGYVMTKSGIAWDDRFLRADRKPALAFAGTGTGIALGSRVLRTVAEPATVPARTLQVAGDWREILEVVEPDPVTGMLSAIPVHGPGDSIAGAGVLRVSDWSVRHERVELDFEVEGGDCWVRLAISWYPYLDLRLNREPVEFHRTADGFVYLRVSEGAHRLSVHAPLGRLRTVLMPVSLLAIIGCVVFMARPARSRKRKKGVINGRR